MVMDKEVNCQPNISSHHDLRSSKDSIQRAWGVKVEGHHRKFLSGTRERFPYLRVLRAVFEPRWRVPLSGILVIAKLVNPLSST